jgi:hypothetical protein
MANVVKLPARYAKPSPQPRTTRRDDPQRLAYARALAELNTVKKAIADNEKRKATISSVVLDLVNEVDEASETLEQAKQEALLGWLAATRSPALCARRAKHSPRPRTGSIPHEPPTLS